jgi:hypothetical protein
MKVIFTFLITAVLFLIIYVIYSKGLIGTEYHIDDFVDEYTTLNRTNGEIVIDSLVADYVRKDGYIMALRIPTISKDCKSDSGELIIETFYSRDVEYFIIELKSNKVYGPMNTSEYQKELRRFQISNPDLKADSFWFTNLSFQDWNTRCLNEKRNRNKEVKGDGGH